MRERTLALAGFIAFSAISANVIAADPPEARANALRIAGPVLMVNDLDRSLRFYTEGLGMAVGSRLPGKPGPGVTVVALGGERFPFILLRQRGPEARSTPAIEMGAGLSRIMVTVANARAVEARLKAAGYSPSTPNSRNIFFVNDPDGYRYEVMEISR
jgi:catechol 2,3-dioxygenase-like lactoylglutathione lyase family enzyme